MAACRAVILASLWPDPADPLCPQRFKDEVARLMKEFRDKRGGKARNWDDPLELRQALLDFIADFANWDNSTNKDFLDVSRILVQVAHESLGGTPGTKPLIVDPFAGGGAIPLEVLRVGADAFASDLNPVAVLLNKVVLEHIPKYGQRLAEEVRKWGEWIKQEAEKELAEFYPNDPDGTTPIAYLWARKIRCEGPGCGAGVPLIRSLWLAKKTNRSIALQLVPHPKAKRVDFQVIVKQSDGWVDQANLKTKIKNPKFEGTVKRGSATCACCGYTTPVARVREQLKLRRGGACDSQLLCVVMVSKSEHGRIYRLPSTRESKVIKNASQALEDKKATNSSSAPLIPDEELDIRAIRLNWCMLYGISTFGDLFTARQLLTLTTLCGLVKSVAKELSMGADPELAKAVVTSLGLIVDKVAQYNSSLCRWKASGENLVDTFGRQALPMVWDFAEAQPFGGASGDWGAQLDWYLDAIAITNSIMHKDFHAHVECASATAHPLPDDSAHGLITDPPYYDAIPYAYLSDFFYVWLKRSLPESYYAFLNSSLTPKDNEIIVDRPHALSNSHKDLAFYEAELTKAFVEGRRVAIPCGIGLVVFASKTTKSWESVLQALLSAGWVISGSWPIDTEMATKVAAIGQARLMSSVHIVCRPREDSGGSVRTDEIGDWRDVLEKLPHRIHEWMPRLAKEGVVGADAIFSCLGPALEIFSRYSKVEKADGSEVRLSEYLTHVWAAVAREALNMIFEGADASGFEEDSRLTALWLWTLHTSANGLDSQKELGVDEEEESEDEEEVGTQKGTSKAFVLEYDAARKIAQGLGAHLEDLGRPGGIVEIKGDKARLLSVEERYKYLFGKEDSGQTSPRRKKAKVADLVDQMEGRADAGQVLITESAAGLKPGQTTLDRIHQAMLLFQNGQSEALRRFLVDDGIGKDERFWHLSQSLSALYPSATDEKRWIDGVLARKKGLGF